MDEEEPFQYLHVPCMNFACRKQGRHMVKTFYPEGFDDDWMVRGGNCDFVNGTSAGAAFEQNRAKHTERRRARPNTFNPAPFEPSPLDSMDLGQVAEAEENPPDHAKAQDGEPCEEEIEKGTEISSDTPKRSNNAEPNAQGKEANCKFGEIMVAREEKWKAKTWRWLLSMIKTMDKDVTRYLTFTIFVQTHSSSTLPPLSHSVNESFKTVLQRKRYLEAQFRHQNPGLGHAFVESIEEDILESAKLKPEPDNAIMDAFLMDNFGVTTVEGAENMLRDERQRTYEFLCHSYGVTNFEDAKRVILAQFDRVMELENEVEGAREARSENAIAQSTIRELERKLKALEEHDELEFGIQEVTVMVLERMIEDLEAKVANLTSELEGKTEAVAAIAKERVHFVKREQQITALQYKLTRFQVMWKMKSDLAESANKAKEAATLEASQWHMKNKEFETKIYKLEQQLRQYRDRPTEPVTFTNVPRDMSTGSKIWIPRTKEECRIQLETTFDRGRSLAPPDASFVFQKR